MYKAFPDSKVSLQLRESINFRLTESLLHIFEAIQEVKNSKNLEYLINKIKKIDIDKKINPFLFTINSHLINLIENSETEKAINFCTYKIDVKNFDEITFIRFDEISRHYKPLAFDFLSYGIVKIPVIKKIDNLLFKENKKNSIEALNLISKIDKNYFNEINIFVSKILFLKASNLKAGCSYNAFGMIYIEQTFSSSVEEMIDTIIHETAHHYLHAISFDDEILKNDPKELYTAPLRIEKRPLIGIYHAVFVIARLINFFNKIIDSNQNIKINKTFFEEKIDYYKKRYLLGYETLNKYGQFTKVGYEIFECTSKLVF